MKTLGNRLPEGTAWGVILPVFALASVLVPVVHLAAKARPTQILAVASQLGEHNVVSVGDRHAPSIGHGVWLGARLWRLESGSCVARSSIAFVLCCFLGMDASVLLGATSGRSAEAHCWCEVNGLPIDDSADVAERYPTFDRPLLPLAAR